MAGRITRHRTTTSDADAISSTNEPQLISAELAQRHFLTFHNSISRLQRIQFQLAVNGSLANDDDNDDDENSTNNIQNQDSSTEELLKLHYNFALSKGPFIRPRRQASSSATTITNNTHHHSSPSNTNTTFFIPPILSGAENCEIRLITDPAHPAYRQCGLFASRKIPANSFIMPYSGLVTLVGTIPSSQTYIMSYGGEDSDLGIDAEFFGNFARFANDPRGTGLQSNTVAAMKMTRLGEAFTALISTRLILEGEEILLDYGKKHKLSKTPLISRKGTLLTHDRPVIPFRYAQEVLMKNKNHHHKQNPSPLHAVWSCYQCGQANYGGDFLNMSWAVAVTCAKCGQPRANETVPAILVADELKEKDDNKNRRRERNEEDEEIEEQETKEESENEHIKEEDDKAESTGLFKDNVLSPHFTAERATVNDDLRGRTRGFQGSTTEECSVPAQWPLQFPFVSWQVWDTEVTTFAINGNAKQPFTGQSSIVVAEIAEGDDDNNDKNNEDSQLSFHQKDSISKRGDDDDENENNNISAFHGVFCSAGGRSDDELGVVGGIIVNKAWSSNGMNRRRKFFGFPSLDCDDNDDDDDEEEEEETCSSFDSDDSDVVFVGENKQQQVIMKKENHHDDQTAPASETASNSSDDNSPEDDESDQPLVSDHHHTDDDGDADASDNNIPQASSFITPYFIFNLRHLNISHRPLVRLPQGELDVTPTIRLPHPPMSQPFAPDLIDYLFYPTNEAQHLRVATPKRRNEAIRRRKTLLAQPNEGKAMTRNYLPTEAFDHVPDTSFVNRAPNSTLEIVRDPVGFIYIAIVAVEDVPRWSEIVI